MLLHWSDWRESHLPWPCTVPGTAAFTWQHDDKFLLLQQWSSVELSCCAQTFYSLDHPRLHRGYTPQAFLKMMWMVLWGSSAVPKEEQCQNLFVCWERRSILFILCSLNASRCLFACCLLLATHTCNKHCYSPLLEYKPSLMGCKIRFRCICMHTALCAVLPCSSASAEEANWSKALSGGDHRVQLSLKIWVLVHCLGIWCGESLYSYLHRDVWNKWGNVAS